VHQESGSVPGADAQPERVEDTPAEGALPPAVDAPEIGRPEPPRGETGPDYKDRWLRAEAELQNYRKRVQREFEELRRGAEEGALVELLPVLDDLERALEAARDHETRSVEEGVRLVHAELAAALEREGLAEIETNGRFDPHVHEALLSQPSEAEEGSVLEVVQKGYRLGDRVVRPARVVIAAAPAEADGDR